MSHPKLNANSMCTVYNWYKKIRTVYPSHNHVISQIQLPNYLFMIYNRYNPCHVVYVLYNCTISFEGLSYPIHILIITR